MSGLGDFLKEVAPGLATALGGPLAGAAVGFIANKLGVDPAVVEQTVAGMTPADLVKMKEIDTQFQEEMGRQGIAIQLAQISTNTEEAKSTNWFIAGWRPAVGWVCAVALAYVAVLEPILRFVMVAIGHAVAFPVIDTTLTMQVLVGMLGLGTMRSVEKWNGSAGNH